MNTYWYLLDTNALNALTAAERSSQLVLTRCRVPSEVLHEAQGLPEIEALKRLEYKTDASLLENLREVMATVDPSDSRLVDLYHNRGNADPILIAAALHATRAPEPTLFDRWLIVSDDRTLRKKATSFGVETRSVAQFKTLLAGTQH